MSSTTTANRLVRKVFKSRAVPVRGNEIDTDRIIPARFLKEITFEHMGDYLFQDARFTEEGKPKPHPLNETKFKGAELMIVENNFGCGSSREHAPQAIMRYGIQAIIGESFAEIFAGNCKAIGVPTVTAYREVIQELLAYAESNPEAFIELDLEVKELRYAGKTASVAIPEGRRQAFLSGTWDETAMLKQNMDKIKATAAQLPYFSNFS